jgi:hypothetical protein
MWNHIQTFTEEYEDPRNPESGYLCTRGAMQRVHVLESDTKTFLNTIRMSHTFNNTPSRDLRRSQAWYF